MNIVHFIGMGLIWLIAIALLLAYPFSEFARSMATNPAAFERSRGAMLISAIGMAIIAGLLSGCAANNQGAIRERIIEVEKPIAIQPIKPADLPAPPQPAGPRPPSLRQAADLMHSKWCESIAYILKADPLLRLSAGLPPAALPEFPECKSAP